MAAKINHLKHWIAQVVCSDCQHTICYLYMVWYGMVWYDMV